MYSLHQKPLIPGVDTNLRRNRYWKLLVLLFGHLDTPSKGRNDNALERSGDDFLLLPSRDSLVLPKNVESSRGN